MNKSWNKFNKNIDNNKGKLVKFNIIKLDKFFICIIIIIILIIYNFSLLSTNGVSSNGVQILVFNKTYLQENDYYGKNLIIHQLETDKEVPVCNNTPSDISMWQNETGNIWWELYDESGGGTYRVLKNGTVVVNWTEWNNSKSIDYVINDTSSPGRTKYTIEFKDRSGNSNSDDVYVFVIKEGWPLSTHPNDIVAYTGDYISINWGLRDKEYDNPSDPYKYYYRVLLNGTVVKNWTEWPEIDSPMSPGARSDILYHVDTSEVGTYNYTIQFKDPDGHFGNDTMFVKILWGGSGEIPGSKIFQWKYLYQIIPNFLFLMEFILIFCVLIYCYYKMKKIILKG
ncbi:MAG: hypothetical protein ACTSUG_17675 [Candidatus Helarchaeota archaeon]